MEEWQKQIAGAITTVDELDKAIGLSAKERKEISIVAGRFRMAVTPYYLGLIDRNDPDCPIRKQAIPSISELNFSDCESADPIGDERNSPVKGVIQRYPDRVLLLPTYRCAMYCRHCFRRRVVGSNDALLTEEEMMRAIRYVSEHVEIREVIVSGGDPFTLPDAIIEKLLAQIKTIPHVRWIRVHTRVFVTLPCRITVKLVKILKAAKPIIVVTQANHPREVTREFVKAARRAADAGILLLNQNVLLKGVNDDAEILKELYYKLVECGVKPYYMHQCDLAKGTGHFRTTVGKGMQIMKKLRGHVSGLCLPEYMIDTPGGYGKVPVDYRHLKSYEKGVCKLETFKGDVREYRE